ncbi:acinetodin/klebsidin/J25 family lasso peptide [Salmonella enterica subsp. enterica]|nr:acinetodin/klebsidin/J25 family lasso peptide [Salmonella enterica subsp. enterica serovar Enteritidis]
MFKKLFSSSKGHAVKKIPGVVRIQIPASQLTKGGRGHIAEYFSGPITQVSFYG